MVFPSAKAGLEKVNGPKVPETRVAVGRVGVNVVGIGVVVDGTGVAVAGTAVDVGCKVGGGAQATTINTSAKNRTKRFIIYLFINYFLGILPQIAK